MPHADTVRGPGPQVSSPCWRAERRGGCDGDILGPVNDDLREGAARARSLIAGGRCEPAQFRGLLGGIPPAARDAWVDAALGLGEIPDDGPALPRGCVPYLPCSVDALLRLTASAPVTGADVFVDVGSGLGRAATLVHLLTGARAIGVEVQPALVAASRALVETLRLPRVSFLEGDAAELIPTLTAGSVFFLYCPFSGDRLVKLLADLEPVARDRRMSIACVDLELPPCRWLERAPSRWADLAIYRGTRKDGRTGTSEMTP
jgi:SAM-dependent methyltransferase